MAMQYFLIIGAFLVGKTVDVILDRPIDYAIDKIDEKLGITSTRFAFFHSFLPSFVKVTTISAFCSTDL